MNNLNTTYKIVLVNDTAESGDKSPIAPTDKGTEQTKNTTTPSDGSGIATAIKPYVFYKKYVSPFIRQGIQYQIGTVALRTGNHELQSRMQSMYDIGSQAFGFVESTVVGGMVGGWVGAIAGAVMSLMNTAVTLSQKIETYSIQKEQESMSIALMNVRAGGSVATTNGRRR